MSTRLYDRRHAVRDRRFVAIHPRWNDVAFWKEIWRVNALDEARATRGYEAKKARETEQSVGGKKQKEEKRRRR